MIKAKDIQNAEDLREWLRHSELTFGFERTKDAVIQVSVRAALRQFPVIFFGMPAERDINGKTIAVFRAALLAQLAGFGPVQLGNEILNAGGQAVLTQLDKTALLYNQEAELSLVIVLDAMKLALTEGYGPGYLAELLFSENLNGGTLLEMRLQDCKLISDNIELGSLTLWSSRENPFSGEWLNFCARLQNSARTDDSDWSFWIDWYDGLLEGRQMPPAMLSEIALIDNEHWQAGPQVINPMIHEIRQNHARKATPNAEEIVQNPDTGLLDVVATSSLAENRLRDVQAKMRDAADIFEGQGGLNGPYGDLMAEVDLVRRAAQRNTPRPIGLYDACRRAARRVAGKVAQGHCPQNDALVEDFIGQLTEAAFDITGFNDDVRAVVANRALLKLEERSQANPELAAEHLLPAAQEVVTITEGDLQEEYQQDAKTAADPDAGDKARAAALYRLASRTFRIAKWATLSGAAGYAGMSQLPGAVEGIKIVVNLPAYQAALKYLLSFF